VANRVKIIFPSNPTAFYLMSFSVFNVALGYSKWLSKTFITGTPTASNHVRIGATLADTMVNLLDNLNANDLDGIASFEASGTNGFYVNLSVAATWTYSNLTDPGSTITTLYYETITTLEPETLSSLVYKDISIRIFDTYVNERVLIEELASATACNIEWNAGDDLYKEIMASNCVFNMLVPEADDAHFIHLFSGDEQRYRVEVVGVDEDDNELLIWKGFLLPDPYNEPYQQVSFFVDFTATDMISALKGKYLPPWYYHNTIPIAQVFAYCLANTGLSQNIVVKPSVVPDGDLFTWNAICVDMREFLEDDKYKDCFKIVESLLKSNVLTLSSFRGYWWLEGVHRKGEVDTTNYQFDTDGNRIGDLIVSKNVVDCIGSLQPTPNFTANTPWKKVNVNFKVNGTKNLFTDSVVNITKSNQFYSVYKTVGYPLPTELITQYYSVVKMKKWLENLNGEFLIRDYWNPFAAATNTENFSILYWVRIIPSGPGVPDYNYNEAAVLNRYIECPETPFVKPGHLYEMEMEFTIDGVNLDVSETTFKTKLSEGYYDKLIPFQIFIDGVEKYSNRPSFSSDTNLRYVAELSDWLGDSKKISFKLNFNFNADIEGLLKIRFLMPIQNESSGGLENFTWTRVRSDLLKLTLVEDYDENGDTIAVRDINFTKELDFDLEISASVDNSVLNSFSLGYPVDQNYFKTIDRTADNSDYTAHHYFLPNVDLELIYNTFSVPYNLIKHLFENKKLKTVFLEKENGNSFSFSDLWFFYNATNSKISFLKEFDGFPVIPKKYKAYPDVQAEDVLKYMHVQYATENFANRLNWRLYDGEVVDTYPKTVAKALHGVQPEMIYRLEAQALKLLFPDCLIKFYFDDQDRNFIPTTLKLDLFNGKTSFVATEAKFTELTDISYE